MTNNYARHRQTQELIFFGTDDEFTLPHGEPSDWALYRVPPGKKLIYCRLVGEDPNKYCERLKHFPSCCSKCRHETD